MVINDLNMKNIQLTKSLGILAVGMLLFLLQQSVSISATSFDVQSTNLVAHFDASNNQSLDPQDLSVWKSLHDSGVTATLYNATFSSAIGSGSVIFDGSSTYGDLGRLLPDGSSYSIEAWIYRDTNTGSRNIVSTNKSTFWYNGSTLSAGGVGGSYSVVTHSDTTTLQTWQHVAMTFDDSANTMSLFLNGQQVDQRTNVTGTFTEQPLYIGAHSNDAFVPRSFFDGAMAQVRIYDAALTSGAIESNYDITRYQFLTTNNAISFARPSLVDGNTTQGMTFSGVGVTVQAGGSGITMTTGDNQASSVFYEDQLTYQGQQNPGFSTFFTMDIYRATSSTIADGFVFIVAKNTNALGSAGGGLGYQGIPTSIGIEFDTYDNGESSANAIHIDYHVDGVFQTPSDNEIIDSTAGYSELSSNQQFRRYNVWMDYDDTTSGLAIYISSGVTSASDIRPTTPFHTYSIDFSSVGETFYTGFTAATGGADAKYVLNRWYFNNSYLQNSIDLSTSYSEIADLETPVLSYSRNDRNLQVVSASSLDQRAPYFAGYQYQINDETTWQSFVSPFVVEDSGITTITVRSISTTGNTSASVVSSGLVFANTYSVDYIYGLTPNSPTNPQLYKELTIPASKIDEDLSNFPVTIILDDTNYDFTGITYSGIHFTDANNNLLDFEVDAVSTTPNKVVYHVRVPAISSSQDTPVRVFYSTQNDYSNGNNPENVWDANYIFVSHMGVGINNVASATSVSQVNSITYSSGLLGDVANFNGGFIELPSSLNTNAFTKIILATPTQTNALHNIATSANDAVFWIYQGGLRATYSNGFNPITILASPTIQNNQVGFFANRFNNDDSFIWYNNSSTSITLASNNRLTGRASIVIGAYDTAGQNPFRGTMDEVRISNIGRSDAWIKAEY